MFSLNPQSGLGNSPSPIFLTILCDRAWFWSESEVLILQSVKETELFSFVFHQIWHSQHHLQLYGKLEILVSSVVLLGFSSLILRPKWVLRTAVCVEVDKECNCETFRNKNGWVTCSASFCIHLQADQLTEEQIAGNYPPPHPISPNLCSLCNCLLALVVDYFHPALLNKVAVVQGNISLAVFWHVTWSETEHWRIWQLPSSLGRSLVFQNERDIRGWSIHSYHESGLKPTKLQ